MSVSTSKDWWTSFYNDALADLFLVREPKELAETLSFLTSRLDLRPGSVVFDQCCGIGSVSIPLARRGMSVVGVDAIEPYIRRARRDAAELNGACRFEAGDAGEFAPDAPCDGAFNWYSSFGYSDDDGRNLEMLRRAFEALRPGGRFALDTLNVPGLLRDFKPCMTRRGPTSAGEVLLIRESVINHVRGAIEQTWTYVMPDGTRDVRRSSVRLYLPHQVKEMLEKCGFEDVEFFGSVKGEPLEVGSARCILTAGKR
jgi:SAM-dependent methyltransferase